ncbi:dCMP deaminase [Secundilactobacillus malefermentans DSM 5705 = KCTC 3548]|nr:dCMP deaminase [Secundilactobacillus malefermentans DSM 5705 = KCTC 3548]
MRTIHAEMNAILQCAKFGESTDGAEIYVTDFPCLQCTKMLLQAGIVKIYYLRNYHNDPYAEKLIKLKNVALEKVSLTSDILDEASLETYLTD